MKMATLAPMAALLLSAIIWGYNFIVTKILLSALNPYVLAFYSAFGTAAIMAVIFRKGLFDYSRKLLAQTLLASVFGIFLFNLLLNYGMTKTSPVDAALLLSVPCISNISHCLWLKNKLQAINIFAAFLSAAGVVLLVTNGHFSLLRQESVYGNLIIIAGVFAFVIYISLAKTIMGLMKSTHFTTWCFLFGSLFLLIPAFLSGGMTAYKFMDSKNWGHLAFAVLLTGIVANSAYNFGVRKTNIVIASLFSNMIPFFTMLFVFFFYGEHISGLKLISGTLVILGVIVPSAFEGEIGDIP